MDIKKAFSVIDRASGIFPKNEIKFVREQKTTDEIVEKIVDSLNNAYTDKYYTVIDNKEYYSSAPLWYAVIAEKHLDERLFKPLIKLYAQQDDWEYLSEQGEFLAIELTKKYKEKFTDTVVEEVRKILKKNSEAPVLYLFETLNYIDINRYKDWIFDSLQDKNFSWRTPLICLENLRNLEGFKELLDKLYLENIVNEDPYNKDFINIAEIREAYANLEKDPKEKINLYNLLRQENKSWTERYKDFGQLHEIDNYEDPLDEDMDEEISDKDVQKAEDYLSEIKNRFLESLDGEGIYENVGRNEKCPCQSGKKYKKCCQPKRDDINYMLKNPDEYNVRYSMVNTDYKKSDNAVVVIFRFSPLLLRWFIVGFLCNIEKGDIIHTPVATTSYEGAAMSYLDTFEAEFEEIPYNEARNIVLNCIKKGEANGIKINEGVLRYALTVEINRPHIT